MGQIRTNAALGDWLLFAVLAAPHALYAYVWLFPSSWRAVFRRSSVNVFATFATALKGHALLMQICDVETLLLTATAQITKL